jgi:hypothetical protein
VAITQQIQLAAKAVASGIPSGVVIPQHTGHGQRQPGQGAGDARSAIAEIPHHQQAVRGELQQEFLIGPIPLIVEITGDGQLKESRLGTGVLSH